MYRSADTEMLDAPDPTSSAPTIAKLHAPIKQHLDNVNNSLKGIHSGLGKYSKGIDKVGRPRANNLKSVLRWDAFAQQKFKEKPIPFHDEAPQSNSILVNRAIAMHLLREGHFDVASTFVQEANDHTPSSTLPEHVMTDAPDTTAGKQHMQNAQRAWETDFAPSSNMSTELQRHFQGMYHILHELKHNHNLEPAIQWAQKHSQVLDARGSNLEYDLCRLQYTTIFHLHGPTVAVQYARSIFCKFSRRYQTELLQLCGALAFVPNLDSSPYAPHMSNDPSVNNTFSEAAAAFTSEFCALLQLSSASPLLTAVTAGCIALPTLLKLSQIQATARTSWTTAGELPVEIPLPVGYQFHSVFVCPVSKEQSTDLNPPLMIPCGHVVASESLQQLSRNTRFKCPYCPVESHPRDAMKIVF